jgi:hypothetical protein
MPGRESGKSADTRRVNITPAFASAVYGMGTAATHFDAAAGRIASGSSDLAADMVAATVTAPAAYALNAAVVRVADETKGTLIDVLA